MALSKDFKEFIRLLNDHSVRYLLVGGYAIALHGHPRYTKDLDLWIAADEENAENMLEALKEFGFGSLNVASADFMTPNKVIQLGYPPNRIDIMTSLTGVEFEKSFADRIVLQIDGIDVNVIDLSNLKKNKKATGRYQDLADLENLE